jgi:glutamine cyclotransferase
VRRARGLVVAAAAALAATTGLGLGSTSTREAPLYGYKVLASYPHDPQAFTEGLALDGGFLYESTGLNGQSELRKLELRTGRTLRRVRLAHQYFGEGMTVFRGRAYQVTWRQKTGFVYDPGTLRRLRTFGYQGEGWGLANDGTSLILSDGTDVLRFLNPKTFAVKRTIGVRDDAGAPLGALNELEVVRGSICANVFGYTRIACIDPGSGRLRYWIDLTGILPPALRPGDEGAVLNGIAYDRRTGRLLVTGKLWPRIFSIRLVPRS